MKEKVHFIYKTTLLCGTLAGKYYLGKHTGMLTDGYAGSGKILTDYFAKYKKKKGATYIREILEFNPTKEKNAEREKVIIGDLWYTDPDCLNCCEGGCTGGLNTEPWNKGKTGCFSDTAILKMREAKVGKPSPFKGIDGRYSEETLSKIRAASKNRTVSETTRAKIGEKSKGHTLSEGSRKKISEKNFGRKWSEDSKLRIMKPIIQYSKDNVYIREWHGAREAEAELGISYKQIWKGLNGLSKCPGGFIWRYKTEKVG